MRWLIGFALVLALATAGGCGDGGTTGPAATPTAVETQYAALGARETAHHDFAAQAATPELLRAETARYAAAMDSIMDEMMDACAESESHGMMGGHDMGPMQDERDEMGECIEGHHARMDSLPSLDEMRAECEEHHDEMDGRLDRMHDALPDPRMMGPRPGSGGMGRPMM